MKTALDRIPNKFVLHITCPMHLFHLVVPEFGSLDVVTK